MATIPFPTGAKNPNQALAEGYNFYRIRQSLAAYVSGDIFRINAPVLAAFVGPDSDFDTYTFGGLSDVFGAAASQQVFSVLAPCDSLLLQGIPDAKLGGTGFTLQPSWSGTGAAYVPGAGNATPLVDVFLMLRDRVQFPTGRNSRSFTADIFALVGGVATEVLRVPCFGRKHVTVNVNPTVGALALTCDIYGGADTTMLSPVLLGSTTLAAASTDVGEILIENPGYNCLQAKVTVGVNMNYKGVVIGMSDGP